MILNKPLQSNFGRNVLVLAGGTSFAQGVSILATPILTRIYTPEDFGVLAVFGSCVALISVVSSLRYNLALPLIEDDDDAVQLLACAFLCILVMSLAVGLLAWKGDRVITSLLRTPAIHPFLYLLPISIFGASCYNLLSYWHVREKTFSILARTKATQCLGQVATQIIGGIIRDGSSGLILGQLAGQSLGVLALGRHIIKRYGINLKKIKLCRMYSMATRYRRFPLYSSGSGLLNSSGLYLPPLLLAALYGPLAAGLFVLCQKIMSLPLRIIGTSVSQVYLVEAACYQRVQLKSLMVKTVTNLFFIGLLPVISIVIGSCWFGEIFGSKWMQAGNYIRLLGPMFLIQFAVSPVSQTLNIIERQDIQLYWDMIRVVLVIMSFALPYIFNLNHNVAIGTFSFVMSIMYIINIYITLNAVKNEQ